MNPISALVELRVEGDDSTKTIYEKPVITTGHDIQKPPGEFHHCDGTNNNAHPIPGPVCLSALDDVSVITGLEWDG